MILVTVQTSIQLGEHDARKVVKDWIEWWLEQTNEYRAGAADITDSARDLLMAIKRFERANSGDNGK